MIGSNTLFTANGRSRDHLTYMPSADPFNDMPATVTRTAGSQTFGAKADVTMTRANHNVKFGAFDRRDPAARAVSFGITDPTARRLRARMGRSPQRWRPSHLTNGGFPLNQRPAVHHQAASGYARTTLRPGSALNLGLRLVTTRARKARRWAAASAVTYAEKSGKVPEHPTAGAMKVLQRDLLCAAQVLV